MPVSRLGFSAKNFAELPIRVLSSAPSYTHYILDACILPNQIEQIKNIFP